MVSRNAALAEESIRSVLLLSLDPVKASVVLPWQDAQLCFGCRAAEATAAEARRKYEAAKLAADEAERARLAAESLAQEAQARKFLNMLKPALLVVVHELNRL